MEFRESKSGMKAYENGSRYGLKYIEGDVAIFGKASHRSKGSEERAIPLEEIPTEYLEERLGIQKQREKGLTEEIKILEKELEERRKE